VAVSLLGRDNLTNPVWLAPEIMENKEYDSSADIYSLGIVLWEIATRSFPFSQYKQLSSGLQYKLEESVIHGKLVGLTLDLRPTFSNSDASSGYQDLVQVFVVGSSRQ